MNGLVKNFLFVVLLLLASALVLVSLTEPESQKEKLSLSGVAQAVNQQTIKKITVEGETLKIVFLDGKKAVAQKEPGISLLASLNDYSVDPEALKKIDLEIAPEDGLGLFAGQLLSFLLPLLAFGLFFWLMARQARIGAGQVFDFTRAKARLFGEDAENSPQEKITFHQVAGLKEAKEELKEIVDFLKNPKKYLQMGARIPRGVILIGPPGTGKTMLARAVANEAGVPFFSISGSEFIELFVGVGAARSRDLFAQAKKAGRAIIFIDEIDSIGKMRGVGIAGGHEEREQTLNQILAEMDGFERNDGRIVIAATNMPGVLDPALLRPGRFDRRIVLELPDVNDREEILKIHCQGKPLAALVNLREIAERTPGFSGADLANVVNEAAILAARKNQSQVSQGEFLDSIEKVLLGPERKSHILSKKEKEITAFHEAGHALVAAFSKAGEPVRKISIVARGQAAGYTLKMPVEEKKIRSRSEFLAEIAISLGGYCAEKIKFGEMTTGAANDLEKATFLAQRLVKEFGMSSLGPINFDQEAAEPFAFAWPSQNQLADETLLRIDKEVEKFVNQARQAAEKILCQKKPLLEKIARVLIEKETIEKEEFEALIENKQEKPALWRHLKVRVKNV